MVDQESQSLTQESPKRALGVKIAVVLCVGAALAAVANKPKATTTSELETDRRGVIKRSAYIGGNTVAKSRATIDGCCADDDDACLSQLAKDEFECATVVGACPAYDGALVGKYFCVLDGETSPSVASQIGPTCWGDTCCMDDTESVCRDLSGFLINEMWCELEGKYTQVGPTCWGNTCYTGATQSACQELGGSNIGDRFCVLEGTYTTVGPTCEGDTCYTGATREDCGTIGGTNVGDHFCVLEGEYTVAGPWCYTEGEGRTCLHAGCPDGVPGTDIAELWCAIPGNDWFEIGPTCVGEIPATVECFPDETAAACESLDGVTVQNGPEVFPFCMLEGADRTLVGPTCATSGYDPYNPPNVSTYECFPDETRAACDKLGGTDIAGRWCVLDGAYTMIGPLCDNRDVTQCDEIHQRLKQACEQKYELDGTDVGDGTFCIVEGTWAVVDAGWSPNCNEQKGAGVRIYTGGGESVCIVDLSLDDPVESDAAMGSVPRALLVLLLPGLLALGLL